MSKLFSLKQERTPLVHCITNYVTVNDVANALLAFGGSPIMADDRGEVEEITAICDALVLNIGTLNARTIESMAKAGKRANALHHPVVLDPVGAGASSMRTEAAMKLLEEVQFTAIRGNASEIKVLYDKSGSTRGVDASLKDQIGEDNLQKNVCIAKELSRRTGAVVAITGAIDVVANCDKAYTVKNGHPLMGRITGTGCMLSALLAASLSLGLADTCKAVAETVACMGIAGERAFEKMQAQGGGTSGLRTHLIDILYTLTAEEFVHQAKVAAC